MPEPVTKEDIQLIITQLQCQTRRCEEHPDLMRAITRVKKAQLYQKLKSDAIEKSVGDVEAKSVVTLKKLDGIEKTLLALTVKENTKSELAKSQQQDGIKPSALSGKQIGGAIGALTVFIGLVDYFIGCFPKVLAFLATVIKKP